MHLTDLQRQALTALANDGEAGIEVKGGLRCYSRNSLTPVDISRQDRVHLTALGLTNFNGDITDKGREALAQI